MLTDEQIDEIARYGDADSLMAVADLHGKLRDAKTNGEAMRITAEFRKAERASAIRAVLAAQEAQEPTTAEQKLTNAGVFKGAHGLRGLAEAQEFWDKQTYGTRLYYGDGGGDYLHRGVLRAAVKALDAAPVAAASPPPGYVLVPKTGGQDGGDN